MSKYRENSFSKANKILHNLSDGIPHPDPELNKKLMNEMYAKDGNFFLRIEIIDFEAKHEIVGDTAAGLPAIAYVIACLLKQTNQPNVVLKMFNNILEKQMED